MNRSANHFTSPQGYDRSSVKQGSYQLLAIGLTILIAVVSGVVTGNSSGVKEKK